MFKSRKFLLFLAGLMIFTALPFGCGQNDQTSGNNVQTTAAADTVPAETEPPKLTTALPDKDWGGRSFRILGRVHETYKQFQNFEIDSEGITGEIVNDAVYERNAYIAEKYNVTVVGAYTDSGLKAALVKAVTAGDDMYDYSFLLMSEAGSTASGGYLVEMSDLPYADYSMPWWFNDVNESISLLNKFYYTSNMFNLMDKNRTYLLAFNKDKAENYNLGNLYEAVRSGGFTVEKMDEYCAAVSGDLDGDGAMTAKDAYGLGMDSVNAFTVMFQSQDNPIITKDKDGIPSLSVNNEHTIASIEKIISLCSNRNQAFFCEDFQGKVDYDFWSASSYAFYEERSLFSTLHYDLAFIYNWGGIKELLQNIGKSGSNSFSSDYASKESKMLSEMETTLADFEALE